MMRSSFIAITLHFYIASVSCLPFFLKSVFGNVGCTSAIHQELDIEQGLQPDLHTLKNFGYIYRMDTASLKLGPDMDVTFATENTKSIYLPSQAAIVLSRLSLDNGKFILQGRVSKLSANRIQRTKNMEGSLVTFKLETFAPQWHKSLNSKGFITGQLNHIKVVHQKDKQDDLQELIMEIAPAPVVNQEEDASVLEYIASTGSQPKQINWSVKGGCVKRKRLNSKRDQFQEIIESAVLL